MASLDARLAVNLRSETIERGFRAKLRPWGYLAPPLALRGAIAERARTLRAEGRGLVVDNGNFDDLGRIVTALAAESGVVEAALNRVRARVGRSPRRDDLSEAIRKRVDALARKVELASEQAQPLDLGAQLALNPTAVIGVEDITAATWLRVGLDASLMPNLRARLRRRNEAVARDAALVVRDLRMRAPRTTYYPVASAIDYDTAFDAGVAFADAGLGAAAMGFGAYMAEDRYADSVTIDGQRRSLAARMPMRYLLTAMVARGFWDGYKDSSRRSPKAFHFLGLGAPIMMGVVSVAASGTRTITFDATSPIRDAVEGTMYFSAPTYLKVRTRRAAEHLAHGDWTRWTCSCPFCRAFVTAHPFDYRAGRAWSAQRGPDAVVTAADLRPGRPLARAYPLLSEPSAGPLRTQVNLTRSGHNHWVLERVLADLCRHGASRSTLVAHVRGIVDTYGDATTSESFAGAVRTAFDIAYKGTKAI